MEYLQNFEVKEENNTVLILIFGLRVVSTVIISFGLIKNTFFQETFIGVTISIWCVLAGLLIAMGASIIGIKHIINSGNKFINGLTLVIHTVIFMLFVYKYFF